MNSLMPTDEEAKRPAPTVKPVVAAQPAAPPVPASANAAPAISVKGLSVFFGQHQVLKKVSLEVKANAVTAIIGPSGCGKSTFLRSLNRMHELVPEARMDGEIKLFGQDIYNKSVEPVIVRRRVGMVFQRPNPFPKSIFDNVAYGLRINGSKLPISEAVEKSLRHAALWDEVKEHLHKSAYELSGGQQQRLCIARTVAVRPEVILFDEPCSALDPISTAKIEELIDELTDDYTIVIVTHNMQQAARVSEFTAFMYLGELVEFDSTSKMFTAPHDQRTQDYITGRFG